MPTINNRFENLTLERLQEIYDIVSIPVSTGLTVGVTTITGGTVGRVLFEGTGNVLQESANLFWDNTNNRLGIGTASPFTPVDIVGPSGRTTFIGTSRLGLTVRGSVNQDEYNGIDFVGGSGTTNPIGRIAVKSTSSGSVLEFGISNVFANGITKKFTFDFLGRLGVDFGSQSLNGYSALFGDGTNSGYHYVGIKASATDLYIGQSGGSPFGLTGPAPTILSNAGTSFSIGTLPAVPFVLGTNNTERMRIVGTTGNVLIGTTTDAGYKLDVNGNVRLQGTILGAAAISASTYGVALGYNAQAGSAAHAIAIGYNALASANPSYAFGYNATASAQYATAFSRGTASAINSVAWGNYTIANGVSSIAGGDGAYSYLNNQLTIGGYMTYRGDSQYSLYTGNLNTGIVSSGGTYSFTGIRPSNYQFSVDVSQIWYVECVVVFAVKGKTAAITEFGLRDTYSIKYKLALKSTNSLGTTIIGTPVADSAFSDASMATTSVTFTIVSNNLVVNVTPPTWTSGGQMQFRGTASFQFTELGVYSQPF